MSLDSVQNEYEWNPIISLESCAASTVWPVLTMAVAIEISEKECATLLYRLVQLAIIFLNETLLQIVFKVLTLILI